MSRIVFLNRFFRPDASATSQLLSDLALHLAGQGREVHVVTSALANAGPGREMFRGVAIHRLKTRPLGRPGLAFRAADYARFYMRSAALLARMLRRGDTLVAKTDPPLLSILASCLAAGRGVTVVNWLQDLYPEVAMQLGVPLLRGPLGRVLQALRNASLRRADLNVAISEAMAARLIRLGVARDRVRIVHNWTDDDVIRPVHRADNPLRRAWGIDSAFVVGYSGNLGRAHEAETLLKAADLLRLRPDIVFLFIGGGHHWAPLQAAAASLGLRNVIFEPFQPRENLAMSLSAPDVHWVSLRPSLDGLILPSKIYGIAAAGRPCIAVTGHGSELARLVTSHGAGRAVAIGDAEDLAATIRDFADDERLRTGTGERARSMLDRHFSKSVALDAWSSLL